GQVGPAMHDEFHAAIADEGGFEHGAGCKLALDAQRVLHAVRILKIGIENREHLQPAAALCLVGDDLPELIVEHGPHDAESCGVLLAEARAERDVLRAHRLPHGPRLLAAEQDTKTAAQHGLAAAIGVVAESEPGPQVDPTVVVIRIGGIADGTGYE